MLKRRQFMQATLALAALGPDRAGAASAQAVLLAGAGRAEVVFPAELYPLDGFVAQRDPLCARVLLLDSGGVRTAIAVIDITSMGAHMVDAMKALLGRVAALPPEQVMLCASHTFSAPHVPPAGGDAVLHCYGAAVAQAAAQALATLQTATLGYGTGLSRVGVNRDVPTPGGWWLGSNDSGYSDPAIGVLRVDGKDGKPLALLLNAAVQPSIMDGSQRTGGGKLVTADLAGAAVRQIEQHYGPASVALFLIGAAGDQAPLMQANRHVLRRDGSVGRSDVREAGFALVELLGEKLGNAALEAAAAIVPMPSPVVALRRHSVELEARVYASRTPPAVPVASMTYEPAGKATLPYVLLQLGELVLIGLQPELSAATGAQIRADSPYRHTMVVTMCDGAAKYLPQRLAYERHTYEARSSPYAPGAAEAAARAINEQLKKTHQGLKQ